jgi:hypothetical protein
VLVKINKNFIMYRRKIYLLGKAIRTPVVGEIRDFPDGNGE